MQVDNTCMNCIDDLQHCECGNTQSYSSDGAVCPHCGELSDLRCANSITCEKCDKVFSVVKVVITTWMATRVDSADDDYIDEDEDEEEDGEYEDYDGDEYGE